MGRHSFALQAEQKGTGHAVMMAGDFIDESSDMLILYGDTPLITGETLTKLVEVHRTEGHSVTVVSSKIEDPTGYGRIMRDDHGGFERIVEHKDATDTQRMINEINTGIYIFNGKELKESLGKLNNNNAQGGILPDRLSGADFEGRRQGGGCCGKGCR